MSLPSGTRSIHARRRRQDEANNVRSTGMCYHDCFEAALRETGCTPADTKCRCSQAERKSVKNSIESCIMERCSTDASREFLETIAMPCSSVISPSSSVVASNKHDDSLHDWSKRFTSAAPAIQIDDDGTVTVPNRSGSQAWEHGSRAGVVSLIVGISVYVAAWAIGLGIATVFALWLARRRRRARQARAFANAQAFPTNLWVPPMPMTPGNQIKSFNPSVLSSPVPVSPLSTQPPGGPEISTQVPGSEASGSVRLVQQPAVPSNKNIAFELPGPGAATAPRTSVFDEDLAHRESSREGYMEGTGR